MLDISSGELLLAVGAALVLIGPKELPELAVKGMRWWRDMQNQLRDLKDGVHNTLQDLEFQQINKEILAQQQAFVDAVNPEIALDTSINNPSLQNSEGSAAIQDSEITTTPSMQASTWGKALKKPKKTPVHDQPANP
jgi:Sec-independent protein translocase protein TatA